MIKLFRANRIAFAFGVLLLSVFLGVKAGAWMQSSEKNLEKNIETPKDSSLVNQSAPLKDDFEVSELGSTMEKLALLADDNEQEVKSPPVVVPNKAAPLETELNTDKEPLADPNNVFEVRVWKRFTPAIQKDPLKLKKEPAALEKEFSSLKEGTFFNDPRLSEKFMQIRKDQVWRWRNSFDSLGLFPTSAVEENQRIEKVAQALSDKDLLEIFSVLSDFNLENFFATHNDIFLLVKPTFSFFIESCYSFFESFKHLSYYDRKHFSIYLKENLKLSKKFDNYPEVLDLWGYLLDLCQINCDLALQNDKIYETLDKLSFDFSGSKKKSLHRDDRRRIKFLINEQYFENKCDMLAKQATLIRSCEELLKKMLDVNWLNQNSWFVELNLPQHEDASCQNDNYELTAKVLRGRIQKANEEILRLYLAKEGYAEKYKTKMTQFRKQLLSNKHNGYDWQQDDYKKKSKKKKMFIRF